MVSNRESKFIKSLQLKKFRTAERKFIVEGAKNVLELLESDILVHSLFITEDFHHDHKELLDGSKVEMKIVSEKELIRIGTFKSNNAGLAIAHIPEMASLRPAELTLGFDQISDPGNLGTIIRIADWYGVKQIVCSEDSVDCFSPKVVNATMGSFARVEVHYLDLSVLVKKYDHVCATHLEGEDLHESIFQKPTLALFGNESSGLSQELADQATKKVKIKGYGGAESLNVAISAAVFCDNFKRMTK